MRIASYNTKNLFHIDQPGAKPEFELRALGREIDKFDADVLLLQEVGSQAALEALNDRLANPYPIALCQLGNSTRDIHLGLLSRYPAHVMSHRQAVLNDVDGQEIRLAMSLAQSEQQMTEPLRLQRDLLQATLMLPQGELVLLGVHLKSKGRPLWQTVDSDTIRAAEARYIAGVAQGLLKQNAKLVLAGDFNDVPHATSLAAIDHLELHDPHAARLAKLGRNPTTYWPKRRTRIDRLLLSGNLVSHVQADSARIHIGDRARRASDHFAVSVDLCFPS